MRYYVSSESIQTTARRWCDFPLTGTNLRNVAWSVVGIERLLIYRCTIGPATISRAKVVAIPLWWYYTEERETFEDRMQRKRRLIGREKLGKKKIRFFFVSEWNYSIGYVYTARKFGNCLLTILNIFSLKHRHSAFISTVVTVEHTTKQKALVISTRSSKILDTR